MSRKQLDLELEQTDLEQYAERRGAMHDTRPEAQQTLLEAPSLKRSDYPDTDEGHDEFSRAVFRDSQMRTYGRQRCARYDAAYDAGTLDQLKPETRIVKRHKDCNGDDAEAYVVDLPPRGWVR